MGRSGLDIPTISKQLCFPGRRGGRERASQSHCKGLGTPLTSSVFLSPALFRASALPTHANGENGDYRGISLSHDAVPFKTFA